MKAWGILVAIGAVMILGGVAALANPFAASLAVTTLVGFAFLFAGVVQAWAVFSGWSGVGGRGWAALWAVLSIVAGVWLLANPLEGMVSLTLMLGLVFLFTGVMRIVLGLGMARGGGRWLLLLSGVAGVVIGAVIFGNIAEAATAFLGLLLGIELLSQGVALAALGLIGRGHGR